MHRAALPIAVAAAAVVFLPALAPPSAYSQEDGGVVVRCSPFEFDPKCSPSGWVAFALGDVCMAIGIALILFYLQRRTEKKIASTILEIRTVIQDNEAIKRKQIAHMCLTLKNQFAVILMIVGLLHRSLARAAVYEDIPADIRNSQHDLSRVVAHCSTVVDMTAHMMDPMLVERLRQFLTMVRRVDPAASAGKGVDRYDDIKKDITYLTRKLDEIVGDEDMILK